VMFVGILDMPERSILKVYCCTKSMGA